MLNPYKLRYVIANFGRSYKLINEEIGEIAYQCPYCKELGKKFSDYKLYVNVNKLVYDCKRCGRQGYLAYKDISLLEDDRPSLASLLSAPAEEGSYIRIPKDLLIDYPDTKAFDYMLGRGFSKEDIRKYSFRLPGINESKLIGRVVIPNQIFYSNYTDMFTARSYTGSSLRYYNPPNSQKSKILFNAHNIPENPEYLILNEGPLNSIIAGDLSVASYGKVLSKEQFQIIKRINPYKIYISYDTDAKEQSEDLCKKFLEYSSIKPFLVILPDNKDAVDLGKEKYKEIVFSTQRYSLRSSFIDILSRCL